MIVPNVSVRDYVFSLQSDCPTPPSTDQIGGRNFLTPYVATSNMDIWVSRSRIPPAGFADFTFQVIVTRRTWNLPVLVRQHRIQVVKPLDSTYASYDSGWQTGWEPSKEVRLEIDDVEFNTETNSAGRPCYLGWDYESGALRVYVDEVLKLTTTTDPVHGMYYSPILNFTGVAASVQKGTYQPSIPGICCSIQTTFPVIWDCLPDCMPGFDLTFNRAFECELSSEISWYALVGGVPEYPVLNLDLFPLPETPEDPDCTAGCDCVEPLPEIEITGANSNGLRVKSLYSVTASRALESTVICNPTSQPWGFLCANVLGYRGVCNEVWSQSSVQGVDASYSFIDSSRKFSEVFCGCRNIYDTFPAPDTYVPQVTLVVDGADASAYSATLEHVERHSVNALCFCTGTGVECEGTEGLCPSAWNDYRECHYRADRRMDWHPPLCDGSVPEVVNPWNLVTSEQKFHRAEIQSGDVLYRTSDGQTARDGWRSEEVVTSSGDCSHPRMMEDVRGIIWLQYLRDSGLFGRYSTDRGKTFEPEESLLSNVTKHTISPASQASGLIIRAGFLHNSGSSGPGKIYTSRRAKGDTSWSAFAPIQGSDELDMIFEDDTFHVIPCNDESDRFQLTAVAEGESTPGDWWSTDRGQSFTLVT